MDNPMLKLDHIFDPLLVAHKAYMERVKEQSAYLSMTPVKRLKNFNTLRMGFGRQSGKSSYIARTASSEDFIFCSNTMLTEIMVKLCQGIRTFTYPKVGVTKSRIIHEGHFKTIWIDDAGWEKQEDLDRLFEQFAERCECFILVG